MNPELNANAENKDAVTALAPIAKEKKEKYVLIYRTRNNPHPLYKNFEFMGNLEQAIGRGRKHCEIMNLIFYRVDKFLSDLDNEEKRFLGA